MTRRVSALALVAACAVAGAGASTAGGQVSRVHVVSLRNIAFHPVRLVVRRGDRVQWRWLDAPADHNVTSIGRRRFRGRSTRVRGRYTVRFTRRGTYRYECTIHPGMTGRIVVR